MDSSLVPMLAAAVDPSLIAILVAVGVIILVIFVGLPVMLMKFYRKVDQGKALIVNKLKEEAEVTFTGSVVLPILHRAEVMDISIKTIEIDRRGKDGLICSDNIRADIKVIFFVRVNKTQEDVLKVAQAIGCLRASDPDTLEALFNAKFSEALKTVGKQMDFIELFTERESFRDKILQVIGEDLNGYRLEDAAIDYLEQTPIDSLDEHNILDAQGIKKITQLTTKERIETNQFTNEEKKRIKDQDVSAHKEILALEQDDARAVEIQKREIAAVQTEERATVMILQAQKRQEAEESRIKTDEALAIREENKQREVEIAKTRRQGALAVEAERVEMERALEAISRERKVELERIDKEKQLEKQRKEIAEIIRDRISVEKTVAEEEEQIKDLRALKEADRSKSVKVIGAEADAEEQLVKTIKAADAQEQVSRFKAKERLTLAEADLEAADKTAKAKQRLAEGEQAERAAPGLAEARVKEVHAMALEKEGLAEARVMKEKLQAEAAGQEEKGMAMARVKEADATALEKYGMAQAKVSYEQKLADARSSEEQGMAMARVKEADAAATEKAGVAEASALEKHGLAEAVTIREKLQAEAAGLAEKATAMKALDGVGREHEEFRLKLQTAQSIKLEAIHAQRDIAKAQATVMAEAFKSADIKIVGGDGAFFERFVQAVTMGRSVDGFVDSSESVQAIFKDYLSGQESLPADLKEILTRPALTAGDATNLSLAALLGKMALGADEDKKEKIKTLIEQARALGLDKLKG